MTALRELETIVRDELDDDTVILTPATTARDVDGWDSLANIRIMVAIERHFGMRFHTAEITEIPDVGALADIVAARR